MYKRQVEINRFISQNPDCTVAAIAQGIRRSETVVRKWLAPLVDNGSIIRTRQGRGYTYRSYFKPRVATAPKTTDELYPIGKKAWFGSHFAIAYAPDGSRFIRETQAPYKFAVLARYEGHPLHGTGWRLSEMFISDKILQRAVKTLQDNGKAQPWRALEVLVVPVESFDIVPPKP